MTPKYPAGSLYQILPEYKGVSFRVTRRKANVFDCWRFNSLRKKSEHITPGTYTILSNQEETIMSDTPMEERTNTFFMRRARGHVLIAGLGLAWVVLNIQEKPEVESITILEVNPEVIAYATAHGLLGPKVRIIETDVELWRPERGTKYDVIYCDIWNDVESDNLDQMIRLRDQFKPYLAKKGWFGNWRERDTVRMWKRDNEDRYAALGGDVSKFRVQ